MTFPEISRKFPEGPAPPADLDVCLAVLMLRALHMDQHGVSSLLQRKTLTVGAVERWFRSLELHQAERLCRDRSLTRKARSMIIKSGQTNEELVLNVAETSAEDILQHFRSDYLQRQVPGSEVERRRAAHFADLARMAQVLAHHTERLLRYGGEDFEVGGNIIDGLHFWKKKTGQPVSESIDPLSVYRYAQENQIDEYLAGCLLVHYEGLFGKLPFPEWRQLTREKASKQLLDGLVLLSHSEHLESCPSCKSCQAIGA